MGFICKDFLDFINALNLFEVRYVFMGGYAVVLRGCSRSSGVMDIWIEPTEENYRKMQKVYHHFGLPIDAIPRDDFLGKEIDVFCFGIEPHAIDVMNSVKGLVFEETFNTATVHE